ncbi:MAG: DUF2961 domain-containing protein [Phycisphaerae bacterium]|nr:DUF2961 domain-containing protein [Phycisphaerae bacterium]
MLNLGTQAMFVRRSWRSLLWGVLACLLASHAPLALADSPLANDLGIARLREGRSGRSSSSAKDWRNANGDCRGIEIGETITLADLKGPGMITHMWFTVAATEVFWPRMMTLRIYYDDSEVPAVETPLGDFFAMGNGLRAPVNSMPVSVSSEGRSMNCWWPMPFRKRARVTMTNDSARERIGSLYYFVDWRSVPSLPDDVGYFHARYRQEHPCGKDDYLIADLQGRGHYVGTVLSVRNMYHGWFGEGDDRFFIDGEEEPSLRGTGTEDYFGDAWGFRVFCRPYHGVSIWEGYMAGDRGTAYRWHLVDPVVFTKSLKVTIEHKGSIYNQLAISLGGFVPREDWTSSVAFWYQQGTAKPFSTMPPGPERVLPHTLIFGKDLVETAVFDPPGVVRKESIGFVYIPPAVGGSFTVKFDIPKNAWYQVEPWPAYVVITGIWEPLLDDKPTVGPVDTCDANTDMRPLHLGLHYLRKGEHTLKFVSKGESPKSPQILPGRLAGGLAALIITEIDIKQPPPKKKAEEK